MLCSGRMNRSRKRIYWFSPNWLDRRCDDLLHGRGLWFKSRMAQLRQRKEKKRIEEAFDSFIHAPLGWFTPSSDSFIPSLQHNFVVLSNLSIQFFS
jgi:hypothetical protein